MALFTFFCYVDMNYESHRQGNCYASLCFYLHCVSKSGKITDNKKKHNLKYVAT